MKLFILLLFYLVFPSFYWYFSLGAGQLIYTVSCFLMTFLFLLFGHKKIHPNLPYGTMFILLVATEPYYLTVTVVHNFSSGLSVNDYKEVVRPCLYLLYFSVPFFFVLRSDDIYKLLKHCRYLIIIIAFIDIIKFWNFGELIFHLYNINPFGSKNYIRFSGTFSFSYNYGFVLSFFFIYSFFEKVKLKKGSYIYCLIFLILIILTGSRSILLGFSFLLMILILFHTTKRKQKVYFIGIILSLIPLYYYLTNFDIPIIKDTIVYVERMVYALAGTQEDGTIGTRQSQLKDSMSLLNENFLFGSGPDKKNRGTVEILIGYYLSFWGIIGLSLYIILLFLFFIFSVKIKTSFPEINILCATNIYWLIMICFAGMSTPITDQIRVHQFFYVIQGIICSQWVRFKSTQKIG